MFEKSPIQPEGVSDFKYFSLMFDLRGLHGLKEEYDLVIVGAGLSGAVVAEQAKITSIPKKEKSW